MAAMLTNAVTIAERFLQVAQRTLDALSAAGPWANAFKQYLRVLIAALKKIVETLRTFTEVLTRNADEQDQVSDTKSSGTTATGSGSGSGRTGSGGAGGGGAAKNDGRKDSDKKDSSALEKLGTLVGEARKLGEELGKFGDLFTDENTSTATVAPAQPLPETSAPSLDGSTAPKPATDPVAGREPTVAEPAGLTASAARDSSGLGGAGGGLGGGSGGSGGGLGGGSGGVADNAGDLRVDRTGLGGGAIAAGAIDRGEVVPTSRIAVDPPEPALGTAAAVAAGGLLLAGGGLAAKNALANRIGQPDEPDMRLGQQIT
ncbi:hypothetical protein BLA60_05975 [Actinophytocola xinjiangensis]|uniref:Uncharacterized protein n=1 Tax=Actinophytocola xinjiangensis TaxID=485602 RepID=A0A7Z1B0Z7_9PSEU|nr:hypothetical protein BLA60_05975 [Actinophytocola xinjiangensis]